MAPARQRRQFKWLIIPLIISNYDNQIGCRAKVEMMEDKAQHFNCLWQFPASLSPPPIPVRLELQRRRWARRWVPPARLPANSPSHSLTPPHTGSETIHQSIDYINLSRPQKCQSIPRAIDTETSSVIFIHSLFIHPSIPHAHKHT